MVNEGRLILDMKRNSRNRKDGGKKSFEIEAQCWDNQTRDIYWIFLFMREVVLH